MDDNRIALYDSERILTASEIGSYLYCNRSWWLSQVGGYQPTNIEQMELGEWLHEVHGQEVQAARQLNRRAIALMVAAGVLALLWLVAQVIR